MSWPSSFNNHMFSFCILLQEKLSAENAKKKAEEQEKRIAELEKVNYF